MQFSFTAALVAMVATSALAMEDKPAPSYVQASSSSSAGSAVPASSDKVLPPSYTVPTPSASSSTPSSAVPASSKSQTPLAPSYTYPTYSPSSSLPASSKTIPPVYTKPSVPLNTAYTPTTPITMVRPKPSTPIVPVHRNTSSSSVPEGRSTSTKYQTVVKTVYKYPPGVKNNPYSKTTELISTGVETVPTSAPASSVHSAPPGSVPVYHYTNTTAPYYANTTSQATLTSKVTSSIDTTVTLTMTRPGSGSSSIPASSSDTHIYKSTSTETRRVTVYPASTPVTGPNAYIPKSEELKVPSSFGPGPASPTGYESTPTGSSVPGASKPVEKIPSSFGPGPTSPTGYEASAVPGASAPAGETCPTPSTVTLTETAAVTVTLAPQTVTVTATATANTEGPIQSSKKPHYPTKSAGESSAPVGTGTAPVYTPTGGVPSSRIISTQTRTLTRTQTVTQTATITSTTSTPVTPTPTTTPAPPVGTPIVPSGSAVPGQSNSSSKLSAYIPLPVETPTAEVPAAEKPAQQEPPTYTYEPVEGMKF